jgi:short-subunit dehydrogenase
VGKIIVVTGASRGLGVAIARSLAEPDAILFLSARDAQGLENTAEIVRSAGATAITLALDMTVDADRDTLIAAAETAGPIDIFINNAGVECPLPVTEQTTQDIERQLQLNLHTPIFLTRRVLPRMIANRRGTIVMMSSMAGKSPTPYNAVYSATKFGLNGFVASLQFELAGTGVHIGTVCPGFVAESGMWAAGGVKAPSMMQAVPVMKVVAGVRKVLAGSSEALVTPSPIRPMLALAQIAPGVVGPVTRAFGVVDVMKQRATVERTHRTSK